MEKPKRKTVSARIYEDTHYRLTVWAAKERLQIQDALDRAITGLIGPDEDERQAKPARRKK